MISHNNWRPLFYVGITNFSLVSDRWSKATQLFILVVKSRKQSKSGGGATMEVVSLPFMRPISALITGAATQRPFSLDNLITWTEWSLTKAVLVSVIPCNFFDCIIVCIIFLIIDSSTAKLSRLVHTKLSCCWNALNVVSIKTCQH